MPALAEKGPPSRHVAGPFFLCELGWHLDGLITESPSKGPTYSSITESSLLQVTCLNERRFAIMEIMRLI
jgi:hypothetical protein